MSERIRPLFRTLAIVPTATPAPQAPAEVVENGFNCTQSTPIIVSEVGDITDWIGRNVSRRLWDEITKRANVLGWTIEATPQGELFHVTRLTAGAL